MIYEVNNVLNEVKKWLNERNYSIRHIFAVNDVKIFCRSKISQEHLDEFKKTFGCDLHLNGASFDENGENTEFEYSANHKVLAELKKRIYKWLDVHNFDHDYIMITSVISLNVPKKLSQTQISEFEDEFQVKCRKYSISCNSNQINYEFY